MKMAFRITVKYKIVEGYHIFTSEDLDGFMVASNDMEKAFADVAPVMERLLKDNMGIDAKVEPLRPLSDYSSYEPDIPTVYTSSEPLSYAAIAA